VVRATVVGMIVGVRVGRMIVAHRVVRLAARDLCSVTIAVPRVVQVSAVVMSAALRAVRDLPVAMTVAASVRGARIPDVPIASAPIPGARIQSGRMCDGMTGIARNLVKLHPLNRRRPSRGNRVPRKL